MRKRVGRPALFSRRFGRKIQKPMSVKFAKRHHTMIQKAARRLDLSASDVLALLVERFSAVVTLPPE